jgi:hypothetical protein
MSHSESGGNNGGSYSDYNEELKMIVEDDMDLDYSHGPNCFFPSTFIIVFVRDGSQSRNDFV